MAQTESAEQIRSVRDGVYTAEQADRGEAVFQQECGICHSPSEFAGPGFLRGWDRRTADQLFRLIVNTMPLDSPGRLEAEEYAAVISYFLKLNDLPAGEADLPSDVEGSEGFALSHGSVDGDRARIPGPCGTAMSPHANSTCVPPQPRLTALLDRLAAPPLAKPSLAALDTMEHRKGRRGRRHGERHDPPRLS